jgi:hypothetical protein
MKLATSKIRNVISLHLVSVHNSTGKLAKRFYEWYGKHLLEIEGCGLSGLTISLVLVFLTPLLQTSSYLIFAWWIALFTFILIHALTFLKLARIETHPYEVLQTRHIRGRLLRIDVVIIIYLVALIYLLSHPSLSPIMKNDIFSTLLGLVVVSVVGFSAVIYPLVFLCSITSFREARLSFKTVLIGLQEIQMAKSAPKAKKAHLKRAEALRKKYVRWFENGLLSFNKCLYRLSPSRLEMVDVEQYYRSVFFVTLVGKKQECELVVQQVRILLDCLGKKIPYTDVRYNDLRTFLNALKNIASYEAKKEYPIQELKKMVRVTSLSERVKRFLGSQYVIALVGFLPLLDVAIRIIFSS